MPILPLEKSVYFNGVGVGIGLSDVLITLTYNNVPFLALNASFSIAKTLAVGLTKAVANFELSTGQKVLSFEEILEQLQKSAGPPDAPVQPNP